ncbi:Protein transport protein [Sparassis crispa]|uniref:Protein transport protein n=1 Tax=Sparassis crispa TaxID=139825 RepID=A0A401G7H8_9APHY|nr:Protein transport protein [Sparassis crispa]GBE78125.1 Protein transport protein [Sparassis crispa]
MSQRFRATARSSLRDRTALLPEYYTPPSSGRSSPLNGLQPGGQRFADDLEGQNDEQVNSLTAKVKMLKEITVGIGNEVRDSTVQLSQMNDAFSETSGILAGTFRRMNNMAERQGCRWLWYIVFLIIVFWFFMIVWWFRR